MDSTLKLFAAALKLPETASEKDIIDALLKSQAERPAPGAAVPNEQLTQLSATVTSLVQKLDDQDKANTEAERTRIITSLAADGKAPKGADGKELSREQLLAMDVPTLKMLSANTPVTVPLNARSHTGQTEGVKTFAKRDAAGKILSVDMAALFDHENAQNRQTSPGVSIDQSN